MKISILMLLLLTLVSSMSLSVCVNQSRLTVGTIEIKDFSFQPDSITVPVGTTGINGDQVSHTVTSNDGKFDSAAIKNGGEFNFTFSEPGTYSYYCKIHPSMKGVVTVTAA